MAASAGVTTFRVSFSWTTHPDCPTPCPLPGQKLKTA